jgi:hypothetical protein
MRDDIRDDGGWQRNHRSTTSHENSARFTSWLLLAARRPRRAIDA